MKRRLLGLFLAGILIFASAFLGYKLYPDTNNSQTYGDKTDIAINAVITPLRDDNAANRPQINVPEPEPDRAVLVFKRQYIDRDALNPTACLRFSHTLDPSKQPQYSDFISVMPETNLAVTVNAKTLCFSGFDFAKDYNLTMKAGLPALKSASLAQAVSVELSFGARPPFVGFAGNGIILPRKNAQGLALETVNVKTLDVAIYKVNDRMLARRDPSEGQLTAEGDYGWSYENAAESIRTKIWSDQVEVDSIPNQRVTTILPISELAGDLADGAYIVNISRHSADAKIKRPARAWRWIIVTDLALTTYRGDHGLTVFARSLESAKRLPNTEVHLIANNNAVLGRAVTDKSGKTTYLAPLLGGNGPDKPRMLLAYGADGDFAMIDLRRSPLDLSDYDIAGRKKSSPIDGYGFADRGIYRPGETSHLTFMLRESDISAAKGRLSTLKITRPDNLKAYEVRIKPDAFKAGTFYTDYDIPNEAPRGTWRADLLPDGMDQAFTIAFDVQDFVPQKLRVTLKPEDGVYDGQGELRIGLQADFLYGAPAVDLPADGEARLEIDPKPFPQYKNYSFAPRNPEFSGSLHYLNGGATDESGAVDLVLETLPQIIDSDLPLRLQITGGVAEPSGRYVRDSLFIPARSKPRYAGILSDYTYHRVPKNEDTQFEIILVDQKGDQQSGDLEWVLMDQDWDYQWYKEGGRWRYRRDLREQPLERGPLKIAGDGPTIWSKTLGRGDYRFILKDGERELNSYQFAVGWGQKTTSDKPDALQLSTPERGVKPGERFTLTVTSPYAGEADLILTNDDVFISKPIRLSEGVSEIDLTYDKSWGAGIYTVISLYTPRNIETLPIPRRAVGTGYIRRDIAQSSLQLSFGGPDKAKPRETYNVRLDASQNGIKPKGAVWVNLAAVDEGILQVTKFSSPASDVFFHAKTALGTSIYDDYGRILNPNLGASAIDRSGGDGIGGEGLTVIPQKTVALFKGYVEMKNGSAIIPLDIPNYNGELRLMATAWSDTAVGSASMPLTVRDPVPVDLALPRFLAAGDQVEAVVSANNIDGVEGAYAFKINAGDALSLSAQEVGFDLPRNLRRDKSLLITAKNQGVTDIRYNFTGPNNYNISGETQIQTRSPFLPTTESNQWTIEAGESLTLAPDFISHLVPGSVDVTLSITDGRVIDPSSYIATLRRYPYGCTEQTVSTALPLLYAQDFGETVQPGLRNYKTKMQRAINKLALRQSEDGTFGLWREGDHAASLWLGAYTSDFMLRADAAGYIVDADVLKRTRTALSVLNQLDANKKLGYRVNVNYHDAGKDLQTRKIDTAAYAGYVMARDGRGRLGQARYIFDSFKTRIKSPLSFGFLSETFTRLGDDVRAQAAYDLAVKSLGYEDQDNYYQTPLRDLAALIGILSNETHRQALETRLFDEIESPNRLRTQELAHIILALRAQSPRDSDIRFISSGADFDQQGGDGVLTHASAHIYDRDIKSGVKVTNQGDNQITLKALASGSPLAAPPPISEGFTIMKTLHSLKGDLVSPDNIRRGERYVVKVSFASQQNRGRTVVLADLLPAGFEIEQILQPSDGKKQFNASGPFAWAGNISAFDMTESRDDRFIASGDTRRKDSYIAAYIVRAVSSGNFTFPGAVVEDMYRPGARAISETKRLVISSGGTL